MRRRTLLTTTGSVLGLAGCLSSRDTAGRNEEGSRDDSNESDDLPAPLECEEYDDFERHDSGFAEDELNWGQMEDGDWELSINDDTFKHGDEANITLTNRSDEEQITGNRYKYTVQLKTQVGWQEVRGWVEGMALPYSDEGIIHDPGEGFEWTLTLTEDGLLNGHPHEDDLVVCPGLPNGQYRFVYSGGSPPIAIDFNFTS